ncbi:FAD-dependent cmnm(5)s(2)U34 oxidoreductase [Advenella kashmirensis W13003]|uniref:FAD-dependent cmnm(5)s(2)U34 oxidoreductase n=1 Tax=Advenella kashmirensis W13003 TaxID=1424334 RepID=V8QMH8_9BURK|nr:FAD-dependent oxidoreductase [Advenella kashmirensis]ETF00872.1 FAD-dependent cmnm(5)s(2)U34 oxidoreductase [Advenella kashmirensis W13003]
MSRARTVFNAALGQALARLDDSLRQETTFTAVVLTTHCLDDAVALLAHWQQHAPTRARLHLVFFEDYRGHVADTASADPVPGGTRPAQARRSRLAVANDRDRLASLLAPRDADGVSLLPGVHRADDASSRLTVTRLVGPLSLTLPQLVATVDLFIVESASPLAHVMHYADAMVRLAAPNAFVLAPQDVVGELAQAIRNKGARQLDIQQVNGTWQWMAAHLHRPAKPSAKRARVAWVVGGGLAGAGVAHALALRGWQVHVTDPALATGQPGPQAGHVAAALTPLISVDDNFKARLSRAGVYRAHQRWAGFGADVIPYRSGTLELARSKGHARDLLQAVQARGYPQGWVTLLAPGQSQDLTGVAVARQGAFFAKGMTVSPPNLIRALLAHPAIHCHDLQVDRLDKGPQGWRLHASREGAAVTVAECDTVILAAAAQTPALLARSGLEQRTLKSGRVEQSMPIVMSMDTLGGQVMHVPRTMLTQVPGAVVGAEGYFLPPVAGVCVVGSTYERELSAGGISRQGQKQIVDKLAPALDRDVLQSVSAALAEAGTGPDGARRVSPGDKGRQSMQTGGSSAVPDRDAPPVFTGWSGTRAVIRGRLPAFGAVRHAPGLWLACGYASHGLTWSALAGDVIAAMLEGEPVPLERDLLQAVAPR